MAQSADHILNFFADLRRETAFYLGCCHLHDRLGDAGLPVCVPTALASDDDGWQARALYDPGLAVRSREKVVGNDLDGDHTSLLIVTGANRGGKSTFLRALGLAQIMMQAGMFVAAEEFTTRIRPGVYTHYKREEDVTLRAGKLVEELARMSDLVEKLSPGYLLLMNESFSSTNEADGAEIAHGLVRALLEKGVCVAYVTHSFELADRFGRRAERDVLFLRAGRAEQRPENVQTPPGGAHPDGVRRGSLPANLRPRSPGRHHRRLEVWGRNTSRSRRTSVAFEVSSVMPERKASIRSGVSITVTTTGGSSDRDIAWRR